MAFPFERKNLKKEAGRAEGKKDRSPLPLWRCVFMTVCVCGCVCVAGAYGSMYTCSCVKVCERVGVFKGLTHTRSHELALKWSLCDTSPALGSFFYTCRSRQTNTHLTSHTTRPITVYLSGLLFLWYFLLSEYGWILVKSLLYLKVRGSFIHQWRVRIVHLKEKKK